MKTEQMINSNVALSGMYKFSIQRADGTVEETGWMDNMILNSGLDMLGTSDGYSLIQVLQVGTGTIPVDATQTSLQSLLKTTLSSANVSVSNKGAPLYQTEAISEYHFNQGDVVGNVTEVGVSRQFSTTLFSRCLITDGAGIPTTLSVTASDQLIVYYKLTIFPDVSDSTGSVIINGVTYNYVSRAASSCNITDPFSFMSAAIFNSFGVSPCGDSSTGLAPITGTLDGTLGVTVNTVPQYSAYVAGSYQMTSIVTINPSQITVPIKAMLLSSQGVNTQFVFTPSIPKTNINQLSLTFNHSWGRG